MINPVGIASGLVDALSGTPPQWGGLSSQLVGKLVAWNPALGPKDANGNPLGAADPASPVVAAPITDANLDITLNWQSPFEASGPENKAPTLMAILQSGQAGPILNALQAILPEKATKTLKLDDVAKAAKDFTGMTGITKLNSRQVFSGMPPIKLTLTMHFRAIMDPGSEVMQPYAQLLKWALPKKLAADGVIANVIAAAPNGAAAMLSAMFPSQAPTMVSFSYANERYGPMVIEHISNPIDGHRGITGLPVSRSVQLSLATLTALDANDVANILKRGSLL